jgi:hypothetical protein
VNRLAIAACSVGTLFVVVSLTSQSGDLSPQSQVNLAFALEPSYDEALRRLGHRWPPLYPSVLWVGARFGIPPEVTNLLLFLGTLAALLPAARQLAPAVHPGFPVGLYALCAFNYWNLHQFVSEALLIPIALGLLLLCERCRRGDASRQDLAALTTLAAVACLTRYFAIFWLLPVAAWAGSGPPDRRRWLRAGTVLAIAAAPVGLWMAQARRISGHLTGADRFAPRMYESLTTFGANLELTARTLALDWFGTRGPASHAALRGPWEPSMLEASLLGLAGACIVGCSLAAFRSSRESSTSVPSQPTRGLLLGYFSLGFVVWIWLLWTLGNNDPIYSRFLYPAYVFFLLAGFRIYSQVKLDRASHPGGHWERAPFRALFGLVAAIQAQSSLGTLARLWSG